MLSFVSIVLRRSRSQCWSPQSERRTFERFLPCLPPFNDAGHGGCSSGCIGSYRRNRPSQRISGRGFRATKTVWRYLKLRIDIGVLFICVFGVS